MKSPLLSIHRFSWITCSSAVLALLSGNGTFSHADDNFATASLPFKVEVVEVPNSTLPKLHSYSSATADGKWLICGGRIAGLHGFGNGPDNFPRSTANTVAYVIDPGANKVLGSVDLVKELPAQLAGPLTATNPEFIQVEGDLYIVGGYGKDLQTGEITTFGSIIKIDVAALMKAILAGTPIAGCFKQNPTPDNRLKVTGGALKAFQNSFYLVFGQNFAGHYSVENRDYNRAGGQFQQYTEKIRVFTLNPDVSINTYSQIDGGYDDALPYHRRDLNVVDTILTDGTTPGVTIYGGVFKAGQVAGHTTPIDINFPSKVATVVPANYKAGSNFQQALNHYDCANFTVYDGGSFSSYTTFLGGISQFHYNRTTNKLIQDQVDLANNIDGLPFIDSVSTIQHTPKVSVYAQFIQPFTMPGLLGTDGQFLASAALKKGNQLYPNGVINLGALPGRTLVGHMVGGIESFAPYSLNFPGPGPATVASSRLFEVWVTPAGPGVDANVIPMPPLPLAPTPVPTPSH